MRVIHRNYFALVSVGSNSISSSRFLRCLQLLENLLCNSPDSIQQLEYLISPSSSPANLEKKSSVDAGSVNILVLD